MHTYTYQNTYHLRILLAKCTRTFFRITRDNFFTIHTYIHTYMHTHIHTHTYTHTYMYAYLRAYTFTYMHAYMHIMCEYAGACAHKPSYASLGKTFSCVCVYMCVCMYVCMYIYIYIYIYINIASYCAHRMHMEGIIHVHTNLLLQHLGGLLQAPWYARQKSEFAKE